MKDERGIVSNVDTFAQWTQTDFNINIILPESQDPVKITTNPSSISRGESCDVFLTYGLEDNTLDVTGNLKQVVHTGNAMSEVVLTPNNYKRCFPIDWIKNETRPSGIKMLGDSINGTSLRFSGTPISDDTINIPPLINKFVVSLPTNLSTKHYNWDNSVQETDKYFLNSMRVTITADDGYKFATNMEYSDVMITPTTMTQYLTMTRLSDNKLEFSLKDKSELDLTKLSDVQIDIPACDRSTYRVEIALGLHMTNSGGELIQNVVIGQPITQINLAVIDGMTFMPNIHNYSKDGITINVDTSTGVPYTKAWVSGTPLRDTQITVRDVVKGAKFNVVLPSDGSVLVKAGEEAKLNQFIESGEYIDGVTLVPKDANYKMTQDWRKTITVEPANDHIMMMTSDTETYISGRISENTVITVPILKASGGVVRFIDWPNIPDVTLKAGECLWDTSYNYETHELIDLYNTNHADNPCTWVESTLYPNVNFAATQLYMPDPPIDINVVAKFGTPPNDYGVVTINNAPNGNVLKIHWYPDEGFDIHMSNGHIPLSNDGYFTELYLEPDFKTLVYSLITEHSTEHWWMPYPPKDMTMYAKFVKDESKYLTIYWGRDSSMSGFGKGAKWKTPIPWKVKAFVDDKVYICDPSSIIFDSNYCEMGLSIGDLESNRPVYSANYVDIQMWDPDPQYSSVNSFILSYSGDGGEEWNHISIYEPEDTIVPIEIVGGTGGTTEYRLEYAGWGDIEPPPPDSPTTKPDEPGPGK